MHLHWDGDNDSVDERNLSAALGAGVTPVTVDHAAIKRVRDWIWTLPPPTYPYPIDRSLAARGATVYQQHCLECHAGQPVPRRREGRRAGRPGRGHRPRSAPIRIGSIRTPTEFAANQYALYPESEYRFTHFRKTHGYANQPLDGIWLRGPYLHNGSVPTLRDLLEAAGTAAHGVLSRLRRVRSGRTSASSRTCRQSDGRMFFRFDTSHAGQRQRRAPVRHDAVRRRQAGDCRIHEDVLAKEHDEHATRNRRVVVPARRLARHHREPRAGDSHVDRARPDAGALGLSIGGNR